MDKKYAKILIESLNNEKYLTNEDMRINKKYNIMFSRNELEEYLNFKDMFECDNKNTLKLKTFNSQNIYYFNALELINDINDYLDFFANYNETNVISENYNEVVLSQIASELEGTLRIEGINTTRKHIMNIIKTEELKDINDKIIFNMYQGYKFIVNKPEFNKENFIKLYKLLSFESLKEEDITEEYRNDKVYINVYEGAPLTLLEECMNSLFKFVNDNLNNSKIELMLPFIVHYYIVYIHPFFDFNGRTARMCAIWISFLLGKSYIIPSYLSEAINDDKNNYYKAIEKTRNTHNDLTYFLIYMTKLANKYMLIYKNVDAIKNKLNLTGETLNVNELYYLKKIIINKKIVWFNYKTFINFSNLEITKQGALKILNKLLKLKILKTKKNSKGEKIFTLNENFIEYEMSS